MPVLGLVREQVRLAQALVRVSAQVPGLREQLAPQGLAQEQVLHRHHLPHRRQVSGTGYGVST